MVFPWSDDRRQTAAMHVLPQLELEEGSSVSFATSKSVLSPIKQQDLSSCGLPPKNML